MKKEFALYKGDTYLCGGSKEELAKYLGVSKKCIDHYASPYHKKTRCKKDSNCYLVIEVEGGDSEC